MSATFRRATTRSTVKSIVTTAVLRNISTVNLEVSMNWISVATNDSLPDNSTSVPDWSALPVFSIAYFVAGVLTNGSVLLVFLLNRPLRTAFSVYLINLMIANLVYTLVQTPLDIIRTLYSTWWIGETFCTLYNYLAIVVQGGMYNSHVLITVNRLWALTHPLSYKNHHSRLVACLMCIGMWIYVHTVALPGVIVDTLYYRDPVITNGCTFNIDKQQEWMWSYHTLTVTMAELIVLGAYPFIWYKRHQRNKVRQHDSPHETVKMATRSYHVTTDHDLETKTHGKGARNKDVISRHEHAKKEKHAKEHSSAFVILTVMTAGVLTSWTPSVVYQYYYLATIGKDRHIDVDLLYKITVIMFSLETTLDPVLFTIAMKELKDAFRNLCLCHFKI